MPHSWKAYEKAEKMTALLLEGKFIEKNQQLKVRGIIQIELEED